MITAAGIGSRNNNFAGIRLLAALATLLGHVALMTHHADPFHSAGMRLQVFFSISGFLIAASWRKDPDLGRFLARRFLRIYPSYAILVVVSAAVLVSTSPAGSMRATASWFYLNNLWFHGFDWAFFPAIPRSAVNDSIWALPVEIGLYVVFAALACLRRLRRESLLFAACVAFYFTREADVWMIRNTVEFGVFFLCGVLLFHVERFRDTQHLIGFVAIGCGFCLVDPIFRCLIIAPVAVWVGTRAWPVLRRADRFGDFSLGLFLWHWPVLQFIVLPMHRPLGESMLETVAISLVIACLQWHAVEKPMLSMRPGRRTFARLVGRRENTACRKPPSMSTPSTTTIPPTPITLQGSTRT